MALMGNMQQTPLLANTLLDHAAKWHADAEIVSKNVEGPVTVSTYGQLKTRAQLCSMALQVLGIGAGSMVATMAWNHVRHMETWYGIMGLGAVVHTLNPRLSDKDIRYIMTDAKDVLLLSDITFTAQLARILPHVPGCKGVIFLTDRQHMPVDHGLPCPVYCYEELIGAQAPALAALAPTGGFKWTVLDENAACGLCYTSGTTGNPKGVLYSHRATFLHAIIILQVDSLPLRSSSTCLAIVPMFHACCWGLIFAAPSVGARLVLPGPWLDGASLYTLMEKYQVTVSLGVPTVWLAILAYLEARQLQFSTFKMAVIGGAAPPRSMIETLEGKYGVEVRHLWGMTELCPVGTVGGLKASLGPTSREQQVTIKTKQGRPHVLCDMRIVDDAGKELPHDGHTIGHLQVRGPHTVERYLNLPPAVTADGWFPTGDVAFFDTHGYMSIADRSKDVIKSGGEWISSIEIENLVMGHPAVAEAAVVAIPNSRWGERPLLVVVLKADLQGHGSSHETVRDALYKLMEAHLAKFAVPDDVVFVDEIPHNATGKVSKLTLREMFKDHQPARARM